MWWAIDFLYFYYNIHSCGFLNVCMIIWTIIYRYSLAFVLDIGVSLFSDQLNNSEIKGFFSFNYTYAIAKVKIKSCKYYPLYSTQRKIPEKNLHLQF